MILLSVYFDSLATRISTTKNRFNIEIYNSIVRKMIVFPFTSFIKKSGKCSNFRNSPDFSEDLATLATNQPVPLDKNNPSDESLS